jgi:hypothetical protein
MNPTEAREHLELVEKIIAASSRKLEAGGEFFVCWGLFGAAVAVLNYLVWTRSVGESWSLLGFAFMLPAITFTIWRSRNYRGKYERMSLLQREYLNVLWLTIALAFITSVIGFNLFGRLGLAAIWNVVEAIVLFYIGMHGNRRAIVGGVILIVSIALANFTPAYNMLILGAGVLVGYAGFGVADLLARE